MQLLNEFDKCFFLSEDIVKDSLRTIWLEVQII